MELLAEVLKTGTLQSQHVPEAHCSPKIAENERLGILKTSNYG
jgi:hypothetical protein